MIPALRAWIGWLEQSDLAESIREDANLFPAIESLHVLAISLVVGTILVVDLRLLGLASRQRRLVDLTRSVLPLTWGAFAVAATSGSLLFISNAGHYLANGFFDAKMGLIALAGVNMALCHAIIGRNLAAWPADAALPPVARLSGALSLAVWIAVVACGRWIGFTMALQ
jgi:hypothetical protein